MTGLIDNGIEITRNVAAAPEAVFAAWITPGSFARWFGGNAVEVPRDRLGYLAEAGREWTAVMVLPDGTTIDWSGEFREVSPPTRIVMTITDQPDDALRAAVTVGIAPSGSGSTLQVTQETPGFTDEQRYATIAGWEGFLDELAAIAEGE